MGLGVISGRCGLPKHFYPLNLDLPLLPSLPCGDVMEDRIGFDWGGGVKEMETERLR
jgi:hypothetical protein